MFEIEFKPKIEHANELPLHITFCPMEDITPYEVADCMIIVISLSSGNQLYAKDFQQKLAIYRHFKIYNPNPKE